MQRLVDYWYQRSPWLLLLTPVSVLFRLLVWMRRLAYRAGVLNSQRMTVPVIVVGNITVGGTGKTPLVAWLAGYLSAQGYRPGIVARGYRGKARNWPQQVRPDSDPEIVGDEAVLLAGLTGCPMAVAPDRVAAARELLAHSECDVLISDDGLQHYALQRDIEIIVIDGVRRFGTGFMLPAGPLREPPGRLGEADLVVVNGLGGPGEHQMKLKSGKPRNLLDDSKTRELGEFGNTAVHAIAGIGNPERFFMMLRPKLRKLQTHAFPDHHAFRREDLQFADSAQVLMTAKDAVKCRRYASGREWYIPVSAELPEEFCRQLDRLLASCARKPANFQHPEAAAGNTNGQ